MTDSAIFNRRSVRRYTNEPVTHSQLKDLLHAAMQAPSSYDRRPWSFIVIRERATLDYLSTVIPQWGMLKSAQAAILLIADTTKSTATSYIHDMAAATENILIRITELGLGGCWIGVEYHPDRVKLLREKFDIKEPLIPFSLVSIGCYNHELVKPVNRYDEKRVTWL